MTLDERELFEFFDGLPVAVLAVRGEAVVYANYAARELFGRKIAGTPAEKVVPRELAEGKWSAVAGRLPAEGGEVTVNYRRLGDLTVVVADREDISGDSQRLLSASVTDAMWEHLSVSILAVELVMDRVRDSSDVTSLNYLAMVDRAIHGVARVANNSARTFNGLDRSCNFVNLDLGELVGDLVTTTAALARSKGVQFKYVPPRDEVVYRADPEKMELMLMELISNSLKHTGPGGRITVSVRSTAAGVMITVADTGVGIKPSVLGRVFSRYSCERTKEDPTAGAGFGLGIAQFVAQAHGGKIIIESAPSQGASVTVSLPPTNLGGKDVDLFQEAAKSTIDTILTEYADVLDSSVYIDRNSM